MIVTLFMKCTTSAALNTCISLGSEFHKREDEGTFTSYCKAVNYFLAIYATDDFIADIDADIMLFNQPSNRVPKEYAEAVWNKALRCDWVNEEYVLKGVFIARLPEFIGHSMHSYWSIKNSIQSKIWYRTRRY